MKAKIKNDLDLNEEVFIGDDELTSYFNDAVDAAEQDLLTLNQDYFLATETLTLVNGQSEYDLPSDLYGYKLRGVEYRKETTTFPILPLKYWRKPGEAKAIDASFFGEPRYKYLIKDQDAATGQKLVLYPEAKESGAYVFIFYLRNANRFTTDTDICDLPEAYNYIYAHVKRACLRKEFGGITPPQAEADFQQEKERLVSTLSQAIVDNYTDEVDGDFSHYYEHN